MSFLLYAGFFVLLGVLAAYIGYMLQLCFTQNSYVYHPVHTIDLTTMPEWHETVEFEAPTECVCPVGLYRLKARRDLNPVLPRQRQ